MCLALALAGAPLAAQPAEPPPNSVPTSTGAAGRLVPSLVKSKEWRMRREPQKEEEFIGDVRYWTYSHRVRADWALFRHADQVWEATGAIKAEYHLPRGQGLLEAWGERTRFNQLSRTGTLQGAELKEGGREPVRLALTSDAAGREDGRAGLLSWEVDRWARLEGDVEVRGPRLDLWTDRADYDWKSPGIRLTGGRPVLVKKFGEWSGALRGDSIVARDSPRAGSPAARQVWAEGSVKGWILFPPAAAGLKKANLP